MPEDKTVADATSDSTADGDRKGPDASADPALGPAGEKALEAWKSRAKEAEAKAKTADELAAKLAEYEDRDKSAQQKLQERAETAERNAAAAAAEAMRARVGADKGLPRKFWDRIKGDDEKEMAADADDLLGELSPKDKPRPSFDGGAKDGKSPANGDMNALLLKGARGRSS